MASAISKRQQARNERALQVLIQNVPGNNRCADCAANNPGWSSWSLGIFLCMRCAALHRKLGTHISKVKSLSMDSWTVEQVENMRSVGNVVSNKVFNPQNARPEISVEVDEVDAAMEKFIRQKYEHRAYMHSAAVPQASKHHTGSTGTGSWPDNPPELPPKPAKRFGFSLRSSSSTMAKTRADRYTPPLSPVTGYDKTDALPPRKPSKTGQFFGMKMTSNNNDFDAKLTILREMGFYDARKCAEVLKSMSGDIDRTVETLARLGENEKPLPRSPDSSIKAASGTTSTRASPKLVVDKTRNPQALPSSVANDLWQVKDTPQRSATMPFSHDIRPSSAQPASAAANSWNPFLAQAQPTQSIDSLTNSFQSLQTTNPWQTAQSQSNPSQQQQQQQQYPALYSQTSSPNSALQSQQYSSPTNNPFQAQIPIMQQPLSASNTGQYIQYGNQVVSPNITGNSGNPFLRASRSHSQLPTNPWVQSANTQSFSPAAGPSSIVSSPINPWSTQMQPYAQSPVSQSPSTPFGISHTAFGQNGGDSQSPAAISQNNPFQSYFPQPGPTSVTPQTIQPTTNWAQANHVNLQQAPQSGNPALSSQFSQPNGNLLNMSHLPPGQINGARADKNSILALYNLPNGNFRPLQTLAEDPANAASQAFASQRSQTMPPQQLNGMNPFGPPAPTSQSPFNTQPAGPRHVSNESMAFVGLGGGGRHSPDAFAGLSAQYTRS